MRGWTLKPAALVAAALILVPAARAGGKLDLDIYASGPNLPSTQADAAGLPAYSWVPGDPRDTRGSPTWVKPLSHAGYAGLGAAGLAASIATGGVAPAIGFGIVTAVQAFLEWRELKNPSE
jgi:hypothetical protein